MSRRINQAKELRRIADALERIAGAMERPPSIRGSNDIVLEQTGDGTQQFAGRDVNNNTESFNTNTNEAIKNLTSALKPPEAGEKLLSL